MFIIKVTHSAEKRVAKKQNQNTHKKLPNALPLGFGSTQTTISYNFPKKG